MNEMIPSSCKPFSSTYIKKHTLFKRGEGQNQSKLSMYENAIRKAVTLYAN